MIISSQELNQLSMVEINENVLLNVPETVKIKLFDNIIKEMANNPCLQFLTAEYIGNILFKVYNKSAALCIFNRLYKYTIVNSVGESCKEAFYMRASKIIFTIGLSKCPHMGICPEGVCKRRFEISEDFLNSMTPQTKINLYDKMVTHFINKKDYCFLIFSMKFLVDSLDDCMLSEKSGQLKDMILSLVSSMPIDTCKESIKNSLNNKERNISIFIKSE